ncbi:MAG: preprotein translocase subunit SecG [Clostridiales bacterium]|nr:preprotein translocase subunit SecG [Clostridiales bacterium]
MEVYEIVLGISLIITAISIVILVLLQESKSEGLSGAIAGGAETFFGKNKGRTMEKKLVNLTKIFAVLFFVLSLVTTCLLLFLK